MYIVRTLFRLGKIKQYRKIIFYNRLDALSYIYNDLSDQETLVLFKKDERALDRRG